MKGQPCQQRGQSTLKNTLEARWVPLNRQRARKAAHNLVDETHNLNW